MYDLKRFLKIFLTIRLTLVFTLRIGCGGLGVVFELLQMTFLIGMMNHGGWAALPQRHIQCLQHQLCPKACFHLPSHDPTGKSIHHYRPIKEPRPCRDIRYVRNPQPIRGCDEEVPLHQIRDHLCFFTADGRSDSFAAADTLQSGCPHQAGHPLPTDPKSLLANPKWIRGIP